MLHHMIRRVFRIPFLPALMWAVCILLASTAFGVDVPLPPPQWLEPDKALHTLAYAGLSFLVMLGWHFRSADRPTPKQLIIGLLGCVLYGIVLEWVQYLFFPGRAFEYLDMLANMVGVLLGWITYFFIIK